MTKERPIILRDDEVRSILSNGQMEVRRPVALREFQKSTSRGYDFTFRTKRATWTDYPVHKFLASKFNPYGVPGDTLWVRECFKAYGTLASSPLCNYDQFEAQLFYRSDRSTSKFPVHMDHWRVWLDGPEEDPWRSAAMMPRWASRLQLTVNNVRLVDVGATAPWAWAVGLSVTETKCTHVLQK